MEKIFNPDDHNKKMCEVIKEALSTLTADLEEDVVIEYPSGDWLSDVKEDSNLAKEFLERVELASRWKEFYNAYGCKENTFKEKYYKP